MWVRNTRYDATGIALNQYPRPSALRASDEQNCEGDKWIADFEQWNIKPADDCPGGDASDPSACTHHVTKIHEAWRVDAIDEAVKVDALGTFKNLAVTRETYDLTTQATPVSAKFWFAPGIGKIKERTQHISAEILAGWDIPNAPKRGTVADMGPCDEAWDPSKP